MWVTKDKERIWLNNWLSKTSYQISNRLAKASVANIKFANRSACCFTYKLAYLLKGISNSIFLESSTLSDALLNISVFYKLIFAKFISYSIEITSGLAKST